MRRADNQDNCVIPRRRFQILMVNIKRNLHDTETRLVIKARGLNASKQPQLGNTARWADINRLENERECCEKQTKGVFDAPPLRHTAPGLGWEGSMRRREAEKPTALQRSWNLLCAGCDLTKPSRGAVDDFCFVSRLLCRRFQSSNAHNFWFSLFHVSFDMLELCRPTWVQSMRRSVGLSRSRPHNLIYNYWVSECRALKMNLWDVSEEKPPSTRMMEYRWRWRNFLAQPNVGD